MTAAPHTPPPCMRLPGDFFQRAYDIYPELRRSGGVHDVEFPGGAAAVLVTDYQLARQVLADPTLRKDPTATTSAEVHEFAAQTLPEHSSSQRLPWSDPPEHTHLRGLVADAFSPRTVAALQPRIAQIADKLVAELPVSGHGVLDLMPVYVTPFAVQVICEILGVPAHDHAQFGAWVQTMLMSHYPADERAQAGRRFARYLLGQVRSRREMPDLATRGSQTPSDLLGTLIIRCDDAAADDPATADLPDTDKIVAADRAVATNMTVVLAAGYETTMNLIANSILRLTPAIRDELTAHPGRIDAYVEEILRLQSPAAFSTLRYTTAPLSLGDVVIPPGRVVIVGLGAAGTDPAAFDHPMQVDLDRTGPPHLGFGHGAHYCIGARLARAEAQAALRALLAHYPDLNLATDPADIPVTASLLKAGPDKLPVRLTPPQPGSA